MVGMMNLSIAEVSIWHGVLNPGGHSDLHVHPESLQIYVGLKGVLTVGNGRQESQLEAMTTAVFSPGEDHFIENRSIEDAEVLVISVPGLR